MLYKKKESDISVGIFIIGAKSSFKWCTLFFAWLPQRMLWKRAKRWCWLLLMEALITLTGVKLSQSLSAAARDSNVQNPQFTIQGRTGSKCLGAKKLNSFKRLFSAEFLFQQIITVIWPYLGKGIKERKIILKHIQSYRRVARLKNIFGDCLLPHTPIKGSKITNQENLWGKC